MALDTTELMVLERADYEHILENGFDGELKVCRCRTPQLVPYYMYRTQAAASRNVHPVHRRCYRMGMHRQYKASCCRLFLCF